MHPSINAHAGLAVQTLGHHVQTEVRQNTPGTSKSVTGSLCGALTRISIEEIKMCFNGARCPGSEVKGSSAIGDMVKER